MQHEAESSCALVWSPSAVVTPDTSDESDPPQLHLGAFLREASFFLPTMSLFFHAEGNIVRLADLMTSESLKFCGILCRIPLSEGFLENFSLQKFLVSFEAAFEALKLQSGKFLFTVSKQRAPVSRSI